MSNEFWQKISANLQYIFKNRISTTACHVLDSMWLWCSFLKCLCYRSFYGMDFFFFFFKKFVTECCLVALSRPSPPPSTVANVGISCYLQTLNLPACFVLAITIILKPSSLSAAFDLKGWPTRGSPSLSFSCHFCHLISQHVNLKLQDVLTLFLSVFDVWQ